MNRFLKGSLASIIFGFFVYLVTLFFPNQYQSLAVIKPEIPDNEKVKTTVGALSSIGVSVGMTSKVEDLEVLFKSKDLIVRVVEKNNLWPLIIDGYDNATRTLKLGIIDSIIHGARSRSVNDWDAIREVGKYFSVKTERRTGITYLSFANRSPKISALVLKCFLEEAKSRLQEEALERAKRNKEFIQDQIMKTYDPLSKDRLYTLYGQEVEREMLARNRDQFGFTIIDGPRVPDRKSWPPRLRYSFAAFIAAFLAFAGFEMISRYQRAA